MTRQINPRGTRKAFGCTIVDPHGYPNFITDGDPGYLKTSLRRSIKLVKTDPDRKVVGPKVMGRGLRVRGPAEEMQGCCC